MLRVAYSNSSPLVPCLKRREKVELVRKKVTCLEVFGSLMCHDRYDNRFLFNALNDALKIMKKSIEVFDADNMGI